MDFRGYSSIILILRGEIPRPIGNFRESLSQAILVGLILVGRLGVVLRRPRQWRTRPRSRVRKPHSTPPSCSCSPLHAPISPLSPPYLTLSPPPPFSLPLPLPPSLSLFPMSLRNRCHLKSQRSKEMHPRWQEYNLKTRLQSRKLGERRGYYRHAEP